MSGVKQTATNPAALRLLEAIAWIFAGVSVPAWRNTFLVIDIFPGLSGQAVRRNVSRRASRNHVDPQLPVDYIPKHLSLHR